MPMPGHETLLERRRFLGGVDPHAVEQWAAACEKECAALEERVAALERSLSDVTAERDAAAQNAATLQETVTRLEREREGSAENRVQVVREEAIQFVADAWAEVHAIREEAERQIEQRHAAARDEEAAMQRAFTEERQRREAEAAAEWQRQETEFVAERQRHEAEIAALREQRIQAMAEVEALGRTLLNQTARSEGSPSAPPLAEASAEGTPRAMMQPPALNGNAIARPQSAATPRSEEVEGELLTKALNELETILTATRKPRPNP